MNETAKTMTYEEFEDIQDRIDDSIYDGAYTFTDSKGEPQTVISGISVGYEEVVDGDGVAHKIVQEPRLSRFALLSDDINEIKQYVAIFAQAISDIGAFEYAGWTIIDED